MAKSFSEMYDSLQVLKDNESKLKLLKSLEQLGLEIPPGEVDISKLLMDAGHHDLVKLISKEIK